MRPRRFGGRRLRMLELMQLISVARRSKGNSARGPFLPAKLARRAEGLRPLSLLGSRFVQLEGKKTAASLLVTRHIPHALDGLRREGVTRRLPRVGAFGAGHAEKHPGLAFTR
jgi:hypothetical protein